MSEASPRHLRALSAAGRAALRYKCQVASQANFAGTQDVRVQVARSIDGANRGVIAVRVGKVLIYVEDRDALLSCADAWQEALGYADQAFGPSLPPPRYEIPD
jgi:hypothetical protein